MKTQRTKAKLTIGRLPLSTPVVSFLLLAFTLLLSLQLPCVAQSRQNFTLFGDVRIDDPDTDGVKPQTFDVLLYKGGYVVRRQRLGNNGRYRFLNLTNGIYEVAIEIENIEVARISVLIAGQYADDVRRDINLQWRSVIDRRTSSPGVVSAADIYPRSRSNKSLYDHAVQFIQHKDYPKAITTLKQLLSTDANDFPGWFQLGAVYFVQKDLVDAEKSFVNALTARPTYFPALLNLGRVRLASKNFLGATESLEAALQLEPTSPYANYLLGESYLQSKKGSKAVLYFNAALKLDPIGMADAHLRLATLYNAAGYKDRAAAEYEQFLKKRPDYPDRKKVEHYIAENRKRSSQ